MATCWTALMKKAALIALVTVSTEAEPQPRLGPTGLLLPRTVYLSKNAQADVPEVFVTGGMTTTLRFETPCDPNRTSLLGWEGRFEPLLVGGRSVVIVPRPGLPAGERAMLLVTLTDGTELPFTLTADASRLDWQVNVHPNLASFESDPASEKLVLEIFRDGGRRQGYVDANQSRQDTITVYDGPIESFLVEELGYLPRSTRLYGHVWTGAPNVAIRYYEARPPDGEPIPICAVARLSYGGMKKKPGSPPGGAVLEFSRAGVYIVDGFR